MITSKVIVTDVYKTENQRHTLITTCVKYYSGCNSEYTDWFIEHCYKTSRGGYCTRRFAFGDSSEYRKYLSKLIYKYGFDMQAPVLSTSNCQQLKLSF